MIEAMGDVVRYRPPRAREETTASMGMLIFLGSWAMMFAALLFAYGFMRARLTAWPPPGIPPLPWKLPLGNTLVLALSSGAYQFGVHQIRSARVAKAGPWILLAAALGATFIGLQSVLWSALSQAGLTPSSAGAFSSVFYGLTWLHALHVAVGVCGVAYVGVRSLMRSYSAAKYLPLRLWGLYWHFVGAVWVLMFVGIFLM